MKTLYSTYSVPTSVNVLFTTHKIEECFLVPELYIISFKIKSEATSPLPRKQRSLRNIFPLLCSSYYLCTIQNNIGFYAQ